MEPNITRVLRMLALAGLVLAAGSSFAFGLKTHVWMGQQILHEIRTSCRVEVASTPINVDAQVCESIKAHPGEFLSGTLGPDTYPDLITGQVTTHPGIVGDWQTNDWLMHMYSQARPGRELAFAAGYLVHAAGDVFAHTYVNAYAGDVFILGDERRVELRHFLLEKYIDSKLPNFSLSTNALQVPAAYLRDKLIHNTDASRLAKASKIALHITAMHDVHRNVKNLVRDLDRIEREAADFLIAVPMEIADTSLKIASGEHALATASASLEAAEAGLNAQQLVHDAAYKAFQDATKALRNNVDLINSLGQQAAIARAAAEAAQRLGSDAIEEASKLQNRLIDLDSQIAGIPKLVSKQVCKREVVGTICGIFCPFCGRACKDSVKTVCRAVDHVTDEWTRANDRITGARRQLVNAQARAQKAALDASTNLQIEASKLAEKHSREALNAGLEAAAAAATATYQAHKALLDAQIKAVQDARKAVDHLKAEVAKLRKRLVDLESVKEALVDLVARSDILSGIAKNWVRGMEIAGEDYISTSHRVARDTLVGNANFIAAYLDWWRCTGQAYAAVPVQFGQATCTVENFLHNLDQEAAKIVERVLPPPFNRLYSDYLTLRGRINSEVKNAVNDAGIHLAKLASPDPTTGRFIELLARPQNASKAEMNSAFASAGDSRKPLLVFNHISDRLDSDMGVRDGQLDPAGFPALHNALVLAKLSLMGIPDVRGLAWVLGADADRIREPAAPGRTSLLFDMVRSIDGNHQWQPFGLPYPSASGAAARPANALERRFGFGPNQVRPGFQLFVDDSLRQRMFVRLFKGPMHPGLARDLAGYPFPECMRHPFAVSFNGDGSSRAGDSGCMTGPAIETGPTLGERLRRGLNWLRLNPKN